MIKLRLSILLVIFFGTLLSPFIQNGFVYGQEPPTETPTVPAVETGELEIDDAATDPNKTDAPAPENTTPKEAPIVESRKVDISDSAEAQDELYSQDKLPFRYLNQYLTYSVKDGIVALNEKNYTLNNIELKIESKKIIFTMKEEMLTFFKKGRVSIENESSEELAGTRYELKDNQFAVKRNPLAKVICFQIKSRYSTLKICRTISNNTDQSIKTIRANDSDLGDNGQIVVQDTDDRSKFKVAFSNDDTFYFETQRRKVYPATIRKQKNSEELLVRFVDLDVQTLAWEDKLTIDQRYFEIKMDPLISLRQDMLFPPPVGMTCRAMARRPQLSHRP